ncbi:SCO family protein [Arcticibacterium luteifluviistationis]|uniref:SCO family protein n=1 Tax=Arcticibacterium luteifluviistationis TaxID=1784714 RepID=A0A2Z4GGK4_9BACT|nr:SCO family protein [Arcticibacterium luteifluviistationis]AWW00069.1 SCO family protein [Arcticibacterium luteifluviistationis]
MNRTYFKAGILIVLLVIPALFFVFLKTFGDNQFSLPKYFPVLDESGHVLITEGDTVFNTISDFNLTNQFGDDLAFAELGGDIKVVSFFFTRCGTICPILNRNLARVQESFKADSTVKFLSISIDPEFDTPAVLLKYASEFNPEFKNWQLLTGEKEYIYKLVINEFKLPVADYSGMDSSGNLDIDKAFIHSEKALLLDHDNFVRGIYDATDVLEIDRLKAEIKVLIDMNK